MNEFLLVFRTDYETMNTLAQRTPDELKANAERWMEWIKGITANNNLVSIGNRLLPSGKVVKADHVVADGPYMEIKECLIGYTIVKANTLGEATELAEGCPILAIGGSVEVRQISSI